MNPCASFDEQLTTLLADPPSEPRRSEALGRLRAHAAACPQCRRSIALLEIAALPIGQRDPEIEPPATLLASPSALRLQVARAEREAADAAIARERSLGIPDPAISAGVRRFEESRDQAFLVGVSIPLPFRNRNQGNIAAAEARLRAATAREAIARTDFELEVTQARGQFLAAEARVETLAETSLPQAEEALRLVRIGYRNGRFPLIEVLAAAEARDTIREALIQAQEDRGRLAATLIWLGAQ